MNDKVQEILNEVGKVIRGKDEAIELVMTAMLAKGHILVEDVPGVGKTTLAVAFSRAMELTERRLQFTPDVLPSDVVGFNMIGADGEFQYKPGAILCNLLLADEINRTSTKTQSALLEVMEEGQVTVDGVTRQLPNPFIVVATQNPVGSAGTQMLPESQLDRFMIRISMGYPTMEEEVRLIKERQDINPLDFIQESISKRELLEMQDQVKQELANAWVKLNETWKRVEIANSTLEIARENLKLNTFSYNEGKLPILDVLSSQATWLQAYTSVVSANYQYKVAYAEYVKILGGR